MLRIILFVFGLLLIACDAFAGSPPDEQQKEYREAVVRSWEWTPEMGVALTTTAYARDYLERYEHVFRNFRRTSEFSAENHHVVLFQTRDHDIVVASDPDRLSGRVVFIIIRDSKEITFENARAWTPRYHGYFRFVAWEDDASLDLAVGESASGGTGFVHYSFSIFDLDDPKAERLYSADATYDDHRCPEVITTKTSLPNPEWKTIDGRPALTFEETQVLLLSGPDACRRSDLEVTRRRECRWNPGSQKTQCTSSLSRTARIDELKDIRIGLDWESAARNIRAVISEHERLRKVGFTIESSFLNRLTRHLPGSEREKYVRMLSPGSQNHEE